MGKFSNMYHLTNMELSSIWLCSHLFWNFWSINWTVCLFYLFVSWSNRAIQLTNGLNNKVTRRACYILGSKIASLVVITKEHKMMCTNNLIGWYALMQCTCYHVAYMSAHTNLWNKKGVVRHQTWKYSFFRYKAQRARLWINKVMNQPGVQVTTTHNTAGVTSLQWGTKQR
jgi:hypothetical protein